MKAEYYKIYKINKKENEFKEIFEEFQLLDTVEIKLSENTSYNEEKQGIKLNGKTFLGITRNSSLKRGLYVEIEGVFYLIKNVKNFKQTYILDLAEE